MGRSSFVIATALFVGCAIFAPAQSTRGARVLTPGSNVAGSAGQSFSTNIEILQTEFGAAVQPSGIPFPGTFFNTPASLACIYGLSPGTAYFGPQCNPNRPIPNVIGGSKAIAAVDAFDDPDAVADVTAFSAQFGLPAPNVQVVYAPHGAFPPGSCTGPATQPATDPTGGWELEESLDIEYAHGMAPNATIYLVEAQTNSLLDLFCGVAVASDLVAAAGGGEVSMSFASSEFQAELLGDRVFTTPNVVYFASSGDFPGTSYPASSPNVIAVGGSTLSRNPATGSFENENVWQGEGAGPSLYEPAPLAQTGLVRTRTTPDVVADANPSTGVFVLDSFTGPTTETPCFGGPPCWYIVGGTSVSSPVWAGIVNASNTFAVSTSAEQIKLYGGNRSSFNDITLGSCGSYLGYFAGAGYDVCSGNGSPRGYLR